jgi:Flagellar motor switch protein
MVESQVRPFDFSRLPKLSSRQILISDRLLKLFPQFSDSTEIGSTFLEPLAKDLGISLKLSFAGIGETRLTDFISTMPNPCVAVVFRLLPTEQRMILEVDDMLAKILVERLLGGEVDYPRERTAFSSVEEGVFEFLMLKVLSRLKETPGLEGPASLRISRILYEAKLLADATGADEAGCVLKFHLGLPEGKGGYLRMYFPHPLVEGLLLQDAIAPEDPEMLSRGLDRVGHIKTALWAEVGRVNLMSSELAQLEKEDVILFDDSTAAMGPHGVTGKAVLRVGESPEDGFLAELIDSEGKVVVKLLDFYGG